MVEVILLLVMAPVLVISFVYGLSTLSNRVTLRYALNKAQNQWVLVGLILASLSMLFIPSYRNHDIVQEELLPFGMPSYLFLAFVIIWYVLNLGLGLSRLIAEYYLLLKAKIWRNR